MGVRPLALKSRRPERRDTMSNTPAPVDSAPAGGREFPTVTSREHSETAAEGNDGLDMPEIRMHSQDAAEGPESSEG